MKRFISMLLVLTVFLSSLVFATVTAIAANTADSLVVIARAELGSNNYQKYYNGNKNAWCADFVSWCAQQAGVNSIYASSSCYSMFDVMKNQYHCQEVSTPQKGDIVFFVCSSCSTTAGKWCHVGIMEDSTYSIEGNNWTDGTSRVQRAKSYNHNGDLGYRHGDSTGSITRRYLRPKYTDNDEPVNIGDDFYAFIINTEMWKHLTVEQNNNVDIRTEKAHHCADQVWNFQRQSDGSYKIISLANGRCLDVEDNSSSNYANVTAWPDNGGDNQRWYIYGEAPNYRLKAKCTDCALDVNENCSDDGTNIQMFYDHGGESQAFQIYKLGNESYAISKGSDFTAPVFNLKTGMALENDNGNVVAKKETGSSKQLWRFERQPDGSYKITSCYDGNCLDVYDASHANGANVQVYGNNGNDNQRWYLYEANYYVMLQSKESGYYLDLYEGLAEEGTNIEVWHKNVGDPQIFNIYKGEECQLKSTILTATMNEKNQCVFNWTNTYGKTGYNLKIWKDEVWQGDAQQILWNTKSGIAVDLPTGTYQAYVDAYNYYDTKMSNIVTFTVDNAPVLGDADGDGEVSSIDVTFIQRTCASFDIGIDEDVLMNGDVDGNGVLEIIDATWIQRHLAHMDVPYAIGEKKE